MRECILVPIMEAVHDSNEIPHTTMVFKYFCTKCRKFFLSENGYDEHYCGKNKFVSNE